MLNGNAAQYEISSVQRDNKKLIVHWNDKHRSTFHYLWLRDNCFCADCGDPALGKKQIRIIDIPAEVEPQSIHVGNNQIEIVWEPDGHKSIYKLQWLRQHCYCALEQEHRRHQPVLWDSQIMSCLPEADYGTILACDMDRLQMLQNIRDYGLCFVRNMPPRMGELESFATSFGPIVETNFGQIFEIVVKPERDNKSVANLSTELIPHTDDTYRESFPSITFFHCLVAADDSSGQSIFIDGFKIAEVLRQQDPDAFDWLSRYEVCFRKQDGNQLQMEAYSPIITLDSHGNVTSVHINNLFAAPFDLPEEIVEPFYVAYRKLMHLYTDSKYWFTVGLRPGDLVIFDNHRLLHGRTTISSQNMNRHLRHCYVDRDYLYSQLRVLARRPDVKL